MNNNQPTYKDTEDEQNKVSSNQPKEHNKEKWDDSQAYSNKESHKRYILEKTQEWEEKFDKKFTYPKGHLLDELLRSGLKEQMIKDFIHQTLTEERERIVGMLEGMMYKNNDERFDKDGTETGRDIYGGVYNKALSDAILKVNEKKI